jgi:uracil-DNA glycosylase family 4
MSEKGQNLYRLQQAWSGCTGCKLHEQRSNIVFGYGNPNAQVMIVGEAPGETEDKEGLPFVGAAGGLLDQYLGLTSHRAEVRDLTEDMNATKNYEARETKRWKLRDLLLQEFYFTNVVMCRPPDNRDPTPKEMESCRPRLFSQIYTVDPVIIISAGKVATEVLLGKKVSITQVRGELFDVDIPGAKEGTVRYPVMAVLHPSYLLRTNDFQKGGTGARTFNDFIRAMNIVDLYNKEHYGVVIPPTRPKKEKD